MLPSLLWLYWRKPTRWGVEWGINAIIVAVTFAIGVLGAVGSLYLIVQHASTYHAFAA